MPLINFMLNAIIKVLENFQDDLKLKAMIYIILLSELFSHLT